MMLEPGWDGYRGISVSRDNCNLANRIAGALEDVIKDNPQFIPGGDGSIQVEYHGKEHIVEIYITQKRGQRRGV